MKKLIVVTGATKGIGRAIVEKFVSEGFDAVVCARNINDLEQLKTDLEKNYPESKIMIKPTDISVKSEVESFADYINQLDRPLDILVNNAGYFIPGQIHKEGEGVLESMINTNLYSAYYLTKGLIKGMIDRKDGYIFNICSTASIIPYVNGGSYCISKFAMYGMTKVLREEMKEHGIRVTAILPGATFTASWEGVDLPVERFMKSEDVADAIWSAWSLSKNSVVEEILIRPQLGDI